MFRQCNVGVVEGRFSREEGARRPMKGRYEPELATTKPSAVIGADRVLPRSAPEIRSTRTLSRQNARSSRITSTIANLYMDVETRAVRVASRHQLAAGFGAGSRLSGWVRATRLLRQISCGRAEPGSIRAPASFRAPTPSRLNRTEHRAEHRAIQAPHLPRAFVLAFCSWAETMAFKRAAQRRGVSALFARRVP